MGILVSSSIAGPFYTFASPAVAFTYFVAWMAIALVVLGWALLRDDTLTTT